MMLSKSESGDTSGNLPGAQLLHDVEAISKALYLHKPTRNAPIIGSGAPRHFAEKSQFPDYGLVAKQKSDRERILNKVSRSSSLWNWERPMKALTHLRYRKLSCSFFVHVHSIEGLPATFDNFSLSVQFGRKSEVITTSKSQVLKGMADFDETLMHRCTVYCHKSGQDNSCKYEPKIFLIQPSVLGARGLDIGKHWIDLTRLLPLTFEELEGDKSSGKWTTSFKLAGKAKGAVLNVSFGYLLTTDVILESSGNMSVSQLIDLARRSNEKQIRSGLARLNSSGRLSRSESVPSNLDQGFVPISQLVDGSTCCEVLIPPASELSKSIHILYQKLDEGGLDGSIGSEASTEYLGRHKPDPDLDVELVKQIEEDEDDEIEFDIIEKGVELEVPEKEEISVAQRNACAPNVSGTEMIHTDEIFMGYDVNYDDEVKYNAESLSSSQEDEFTFHENKNEKQSTWAKTAEELFSDFRELLILESPGSTFHAVAEDCDNSDYMEVKSNYKANKLAKRSLSMDDVSESVASDFLDMLENDRLLHGCNSDGDPESPRERLLREFEKEALISGNFLFSLDETEENAESSSGALVEADFGNESEDNMLASLLEAVEEEFDRTCHSLSRRRKSIILEDLETEPLMHDLDFNEKAFQISPRYRCHSGFGSPIELDSSEEEPVEATALGEGFRPFIQT